MLKYVMDLTKKSCVPCEVGAPTLTEKEIKKYSLAVKNWRVRKNPDRIIKEYEFKDFSDAVKFVNRVANLAESEGHHPNIHIHSYNKVTFEIWTHKIGGLHRNDFILASKIDKL